MSLLPRAVPTDSPSSRQHRNSLANAINAVIKMLGSFKMANVTDYETGTWTPVDASDAGLTFTTAEGKYTRIGNICIANLHLVYPGTSNGSLTLVGGLPFSVVGGLSDRQGSLTYTDNTGVSHVVPIGGGSKEVTFYAPAGAQVTNAAMSGHTVFAQFVYPIS